MLTASNRPLNDVVNFGVGWICCGAQFAIDTRIVVGYGSALSHIVGVYFYIDPWHGTNTCFHSLNEMTNREKERERKRQRDRGREWCIDAVYTITEWIKVIGDDRWLCAGSSYWCSFEAQLAMPTANWGRLMFTFTRIQANPATTVRSFYTLIPVTNF